MSDLSAEIKGLQETQRAMERIVAEMHGSKMLNGMRTATLEVFRTATQGVPVKTSRLKSSITPQVTVAGAQIVGVVGSNVSYAAKVEKPGPVREHGRRPYLKPALEENREKILKLLDDTVSAIIRENGSTTG